MHEDKSPDGHGHGHGPARDALDEVYYSLPTTRPEHRPGYRPESRPPPGPPSRRAPSPDGAPDPDQAPQSRRTPARAPAPDPVPAQAPVWGAADRPADDPRSAGRSEQPAPAPPYEVAPYDVPAYEVPPFTGPSTYDEPARRSVPLRAPAPDRHREPDRAPAAPEPSRPEPSRRAEPVGPAEQAGSTPGARPPAPAGPAPAGPEPAAGQDRPAPQPAPADAGPPSPADPIAPAPAPAPADPRRSEPAPEPDAPPTPRLGAPWFSGPKPPLYAPEPGAAVPVRGDADAALVPDLVVDGASHGPLTVRAASVRGDSHRYHGEPRQDALCVARLGDAGPVPAGSPDPGLLLLAVADGVGSARRSHVGSQRVCRDLAEALDPLADELAQCVRDHDELALTALVNSVLGTVGERLAQGAAAADDRPEDYATTLRVLLVPLDPRVRNRGFFAVGDGGAALLREGRWYLDVDVHPDAAPGGDGGGIIDTRTAALPTTRHTQARILGPALPGDLFVLCTDGLSTPLAGDAGMRDFLAAGWGPHAHTPGPVDFLWQLQYRVKSYDDDRTAVCLWEGTP